MKYSKTLWFALSALLGSSFALADTDSQILLIRSAELFRNLNQRAQQQVDSPHAQKSNTNSESSSGAPHQSSIEMDMVGIKLGMTEEEAASALAKRYPNAKRTPVKVEWTSPIKTSFTGGLLSVTADSLSGQNAAKPIDNIVVFFASPPSEHRVIAVHRTADFLRGAEANRSGTYTALESKYGPPDVHNSSASDWYFDIRDRKKTELPKCYYGLLLLLNTGKGGTFSHVGTQAIKDFHDSNSVYAGEAKNCGRLINTLMVGSLESDLLISRLTTLMVDSSAHVSTLSAARESLASAQANNNRTRAEAAKKNTPSF
jgi:hypothetical protein